MAVFVLDKHKKPLMPCSEKRARLLLERGRAVVHRRAPFVIRLKDRRLEESALQPVRLCIGPGSRTTGMALVRETETVDGSTGEARRERTVLVLFEMFHRGHVIRKKLLQRAAYRRSRRYRKTRYRAPRFDNRRRPEGWLPPSLRHRVDTVRKWRVPVLGIRCTGRGSYQRTRLTKHGFPRGYLMRRKRVHGFQTGDLVRAEVPKGKKTGVHIGRVAVRTSGSFNIQTPQGVVQGVHARYCRLLQRADGYGYFFQPKPKEAATSSPA